ncbi:MAG: zinc-binding dehydrogenase [Chloroflexi bacterium]|nr:zinc-binding dehydrogenase [Chloroflexota bacterium]
MKRLAKGDGYGNVYLEEVPVPSITAQQVLVKTHTSLISRGSEILARYRKDGPVDPGAMGYSVAGTVTEAGREARAAGLGPGDRVFVSAPHAEYVVGEVGDEARLLKVPDTMTWHEIPFLALARGGVAWAIASDARPDDTVVVLGQGLVGNLVMQAHRCRGAGRVVAVDMLDIRVRIARECGADEVVHAGQGDPVSEVKRLTGGRGADVVVDCVGGPPGVQSFQHALEMVKTFGTIHLIALYHGQPLLLDSGKIQRKKLIGGYYLTEPLGPLSVRAAELIAGGQMRVEPLITHRFPAAQAAEAFALLDQHIDQALGVLLEWPQ